MRDYGDIDRKKAAMKQVGAVQAILRRWDPMGVLPGELAPADEYDSYAPHIVSMVAQGCSLEALQTHLQRIGKVTTGVQASPDREAEVAGEIIEALRERAV